MSLRLALRVATALVLAGTRARAALTGALVLVTALTGASLTPRPGSAQAVEDCAVEGDEDGNGLSGCDDPGCAAFAACLGSRETTPRLCRNGLDDDADGRIDCDDDDCGQLLFCVETAAARARAAEAGESTPEACANGADDDGDGQIDCADPGCAAACDTAVAPQGGPPPSRIYLPREREARPDVGFLEHDDPRRYPSRHVERPLTYLEGMLVPTLGLSVRDLQFGDPLAHLGAGLSYGVVDFWEVGVMLVPLRLSPNVDFENPGVFTTLRFFDHEVVELALYANVAIPIGRAPGIGAPEPLPNAHALAASRFSDVAHVDLALRARLHLTTHFGIDLTVPVVTVVVSEPEARADLTFDARFTVQLADWVALGLFCGLVLPGPLYEAPKIPFGFFLGGAIPHSRRGPVVDLGLRFGWPLFFDSALAGSQVSADFWQLTLDARVLTYLLP